MATAIAYSPPQTSQNTIMQSIKTTQSQVSKLAEQQSSGQKYIKTSDMTRAQSDQLSTLHNDAAHIEQLQGNAQNFLNKAKLAEESVSRMQSKLNAVANALANSATLTLENKARLQTSVKDALQTMQSELLSSTTDGGYLFASSADPTQAPISDIVNGVHYNADGTSNTTYVIEPSVSNKVTVADGVSFKADFDPSNKSISDSIAALQMIRDDLAQNLPAIRTVARTLFQTAQSELANFLGNDIKVRSQNVVNAMATNDQILDQINQLLETEYASDPVALAATLANLETVMASNLNILAKIMNSPKIWDMVRG